MGIGSAGTGASGDGGMIFGIHDNGVSLSLLDQLETIIQYDLRTRSNLEVAEPCCIWTRECVVSCNAICYVFKVRLLYTVLDVSDVTTELESQLSFSSFRGNQDT
jgi:hypothetical protein